jgi:hypothetical protein
MEQIAKQVQSMRLEAVVIRKDGTREELGTVAYWHRNPLKRLWARFARGIKGRFHPVKG